MCEPNFWCMIMKRHSFAIFGLPFYHTSCQHTFFTNHSFGIAPSVLLTVQHRTVFLCLVFLVSYRQNVRGVHLHKTEEFHAGNLFFFDQVFWRHHIFKLVFIVRYWRPNSLISKTAGKLRCYLVGLSAGKEKDTYAIQNYMLFAFCGNTYPWDC